MKQVSTAGSQPLFVAHPLWSAAKPWSLCLLGRNGKASLFANDIAPDSYPVSMRVCRIVGRIRRALPLQRSQRRLLADRCCNSPVSLVRARNLAPPAEKPDLLLVASTASGLTSAAISEHRICSSSSQSTPDEGRNLHPLCRRV